MGSEFDAVKSQVVTLMDTNFHECIVDWFKQRKLKPLHARVKYSFVQPELKLIYSAP